MKNTTINGYTLQHLIGEGGMAEVWYAENSLGKQAAVKILKPSLALMPEVVARFENEAKVMVKLNHYNIRQVYDYGSVNARPCIIMEYLDGSDLSQRLKSGERFSPVQLQQWWNEMSSALNYTHARDVVHRDIKPSNIFITSEGQLKLLDFGIAKIRSSITLTQTGAHMGTLLYMSPEQVKDSKHLDHRTDLYSLAVTFYHLHAGTAPYDNTQSSAFEIQNKIVYEPLNLQALPLPWQLLLQGYLEKDPSNRPYLHPFSSTSTPAHTANSDSQLYTAETLLKQHNSTKEERTILKPSQPGNGSINKPLPDELTFTAKKKRPVWSIAAVVLLLVFIIVVIFLNTTKTAGTLPLNTENEPIAQTHNEGSTTLTNQGVEIEMVSIPAGTFTMGSPASEVDREDNESPRHQVTLSAFKMSKYEVTFEQYDLFCDATGRSKPADQGWGRDNRPVINVNWDDATAFAEWMGSRLPTEAEWEYACRAGTTTPFNTGNNLTTSQANYDGSPSGGEYRQKTLPVGSFAPNAWGLYDMHGNVWEWCSDWYGDYFASAQTNPKGASSGSYRVYRGGDWYDYALNCRAANRNRGTPDNRHNGFIGFRLVSP